MIVGIEGHLIDAGKISYISPIKGKVGDIGGAYSFCVIVDGALILLEFEQEETAKAAQEECARQSGVGNSDWKPKWEPR